MKTSIHNMAATLAALVVATCAALDADAEAPYVELTGTQVINTGYRMKKASRIDLDFQLTELPSGETFILDDRGGGNFSFYVNGNGRLVYYTSVDSPSTGLPNDYHGLLDRYTVSAFTGNNCIYPGGSDCSDTSQKIVGPFWVGIGDVTLNYPAIIGGVAQDAYGTTIRSDARPKMKVFGVRIYEKVGSVWALVCDCKPAIKNGVAGLYDADASVFMTDSRGTGYELAYGGDIATVTRGDDAYIINTGSDIRGINSRFFWKPGAKIEIEYALTDATGGTGYRIFGAESAGVGQQLSCYVGSSKIGYALGVEGVTNNVTDGLGSLDTNRHRSVIDATNPDNIVCAFLTGTSAQFAQAKGRCLQAANHPVGLMGQCLDATGMTFANPAKMKLYRARIWQDGNLVYDYVPCLKGDIAGLKNVAPDGDGAFLTADLLSYGGDIMTEEDDPFIENTSDYIDTGYKATDKTRIVADMACIGTGRAERSDNWFRLFEARDDSGVFLCAYNNNGTFKGIICDGNANPIPQSTLATVRLNERHEFTLDPVSREILMKTAGFTNSFYQSSTALVTTGKSNTTTLRIFADRNADSDGSHTVKARLYGLKIYEDGNLVRDYVPAIEDGVAGLRDTVNGGFVAGHNASARKPLITAYGAEEDAYLLSTGEQLINSGYFMKGNARIAVDFAFVDATVQQARLFGQDCKDYESLPLRASMLVNGNGYFEFGAGNDTAFTWSGNALAADAKRHLAVLDVNNGNQSWWKISKWNGSNWASEGVSSFTASINGAIATQPMGIFGTPMHADYSDWRNLSKVKIYSVEIDEKENGVDVVKHIYYPAKIAGKVGLYDIHDGLFCTNVTGSATDFIIGGAGFDHGDKGNPFKILNPASGTANIPCEGSTTLTAFAPGAIAYRWEKNGEAISAPEGLSFVIPWVRQNTPDTFTVTPIFNANGVTVEGAQATFVVDYTASPFVIVVR